MGLLISCGKATKREQPALARLSRSLGEEWLILSNFPRLLAGSEIDALVVSPKGVIAVSLKDHHGRITVSSIGPWLRNGEPLDEANFSHAAEEAAQKLKSRLLKRAPGIARGDVYVGSCVVMTSDRCVLDPVADVDLRPVVDTLENAASMIEGLARRNRAQITTATIERMLEGLAVPPGPALSDWLAALQASTAPPPPPPPPPPRPSPPAPLRPRLTEAEIEQRHRLEREAARRAQVERDAAARAAAERAPRLPPPPPPPPPPRAPAPSRGGGLKTLLVILCLAALPVGCTVILSRQKAEEERVGRLVQDLALFDSLDRDRTASADVAGGTARLRVHYRDARPGKDRIQISLSGPGGRGACGPATLSTAAGYTECEFVRLREAPYTFSVSVNGDAVRTLAFRMSDPNRVRRMITGVKIAADVSRPFGSVRDTRNLIGAPTPVGVALRYRRRMDGDRIETRLYLNGRQVDSCLPTPLHGGSSGEHWCQFRRVQAGRGEFRVRINDVEVGRYRFTIRNAAAVPPAPAQPRVQPPRPSRPAAARPSPPARPAETHLCILPGGAQARLDRETCYARGGVIYQ